MANPMIARRSPAVPPALCRPLGVVGVLALLAFGVVALRYAGTGGPGRIDRWALEAMGGTQFAPSATRTFAVFIDHCGEPAGASILVTVVGALCLLARQWRLAVLAVAGPAVTIIASTVLKHVVGRTVVTGSLAFPSGHTAFLTALALVAGLLAAAVLRLGRLGATLLVGGVAVVAGGAVSWSQTVLFAHYATDTIGGLLLALAVTPVVARLLDQAVDRVTVS